MSSGDIIRQRDAGLVAELLDKALILDTPDRRADYERAKVWFEKKHQCEWKAENTANRGRTP